MGGEIVSSNIMQTLDKPNRRKQRMSNSIIITSSYKVIDQEAFKASLTENLGSDANLQKNIKAKLDKVAEEADQNKLEGSTVSIDSMIKTVSSNAQDAIQLTVTDSTSTLTISESFNMTLEVVVTDTLKTANGVDSKVSYTKSFPLNEPSVSGVTSVIAALNSFTEGKLFDKTLTSVEVKSDGTDASSKAS